MTTEKEMLRMLDFHDAKFTIGVIYSSEKQKVAQNMLDEAAAERDMDLKNPETAAYAQQVFTLDGAIEYLKSLKAIQDKFDAKGFPGQKHGAAG